MSFGMTPEQQDTFDALVSKIRKDPWNPALDSEIAQLQADVDPEGKWLKEQISDALLADDTECYSQYRQDWLTRRGSGVEVNPLEERRGIIYSGLLIEEQHSLGTLFSILLSLVPADFANVRKSAKLNRIQWNVLRGFIKGYTIRKMAVLFLKADGDNYSEDGIYGALRDAKHKLDNCTEIGWRTAFAQDMARGKNAVPPAYMTWREVVSFDRQESSMCRPE